MRVRPYRLATTLGCSVAFLFAMNLAVHGQQVTVRSPFQQNSSSFYESNNIAWSGNYRGVNFSFGSPALGTPAFGGYQPSAALKTNFAFTGPNGQINFALSFGQGYKASSVNTTPEVTMMNGQTGYISDTSQTPFVVGVIPVVGGFPMAQPMVAMPPTTLDPRIQAMLQARLDAKEGDAGPANAGQPPANPPQNIPNAKQGAVKQLPADPQGAKRQAMKAPAADLQDPVLQHGVEIAEKIVATQESSAGRAAPSVAEARRMHEQEAAAQAEDYAALLEKAKGLEEDGKPGVAKIYYQRVARHAAGDLRQEALSRLEVLQGGVSH